jgi:hypothetical protein
VRRKTFIVDGVTDLDTNVSVSTAQNANQVVHAVGRDRNGTITTVTVATPYTKWLDQDALYIITPEERDAFLHLVACNS